MRVLFLHTAQNGLSAEYKVHLALSAYASREAFEPYFIWQSPTHIEGMNPDRLITHNFGRNMSITPKPGRIHRAGIMLRELPQALAFLSAKVQQIKPDVLYTSQHRVDVGYAKALSILFRIPHVIHIHYNVGPWLGLHALQTIRRSTRLIAVSEYVRQTALLRGVAPAAIQTVINPVPLSNPCPRPEPHAIRAEFHWTEDTPLIVAVGRLDPGKGHLALLEAFSQVVRQMPEARLLICGNSTTRDGYDALLKERAHELQIHQATVFAGFRNDIPAIMCAANVFCLPTELDPCPLVFLEAMGEGIPVVAFYSGGVPELVLHQQTGLLSYPGDIPMLAKNLQSVLANPAYARQLGEAGKKRVMTEFAPEHVATRWLKVLQEKAK